MNIDILGISELKWTGMGEFNADDHYIYYCGQESFRRNRVDLIVNKRVWNAVLGCKLIKERMTFSFPRQPLSITVIQAYASTTNSEEAEVEQFYEDIQDLLELTPKKDALFKSRDTWSNKQVCPWSTKWSSSKASRGLPREWTGHSKHPLPTTQKTTLHVDITKWSILKSNWLHSLQPKMEDIYTVRKNKTRSRLWARLWTHYQTQT